MLPTSLSLRGHVAWDKFTLYIIYAKCVYNSGIGTKVSMNKTFALLFVLLFQTFAHLSRIENNGYLSSEYKSFVLKAKVELVVSQKPDYHFFSKIVTNISLFEPSNSIDNDNHDDFFRHLLLQQNTIVRSILKDHSAPVLSINQLVSISPHKIIPQSSDSTLPFII